MLIHISKVIKLFSLSTENCLIMFPQHTPPKPFLCLSILLFWLRLNVIKIYYVWYTQIWKLDLWKWSIKEKMWNIKLYWNEFSFRQRSDFCCLFRSSVLTSSTNDVLAFTWITISSRTSKLTKDCQEWEFVMPGF